jgi:hypothetical protein
MNRIFAAAPHRQPQECGCDGVAHDIAPVPVR